MVTYFLTFLKHGFLAFGVFVIPAPELFNHLIYKEKTEQFELGFAESLVPRERVSSLVKSYGYRHINLSNLLINLL